MNGQPSERITRRVWLTAGRDLAVTVVVTLAVIAAIQQGLVGLATLAIEWGWAG